MNKKIILLIFCINCASAHLIINEIMYNPSGEQGSDFYNEWIELFNPTNASLNIENWTLCDDKLVPGYINHTDGGIRFNLTTVIPSNGYALITDGGTGTEVYGNFNVNLSSIALHTNSSNICNGLSNDFDEISLKDSEGTLIDFVNYSSSWGADGDGETLERLNNGWNSSRMCNGTPGFRNSVSVTTTTTSTTSTTTTSTMTSTSTTSTSTSTTTTTSSSTTTSTSTTIRSTTTTLQRPKRHHHYPPLETTSTTTTTTTTSTIPITTTTSTTTTSTTTTTTSTTSTSTTTTIQKVQTPELVGKVISSSKKSGMNRISVIMFILFLSISTIYLICKRAKKKRGLKGL